MSALKNYFVIPVETIYRELDSRLLLALHLVKNNIPVILGWQDEIRHNIISYRNSIYFDKSIRRLFYIVQLVVHPLDVHLSTRCFGFLFQKFLTTHELNR